MKNSQLWRSVTSAVVTGLLFTSVSFAEKDSSTRIHPKAAALSQAVKPALATVIPIAPNKPIIINTTKVGSSDEIVTELNAVVKPGVPMLSLAQNDQPVAKKVQSMASTVPVVNQESEPAASAPEQAKPSGKRLWNLQEADILSVINEVSQETGKNFVVDPRVNGKISLISSKPLRKDEVYQVFLSVLGILGYSAIPSGDVVKIVPNMESGELATAVATNLSPGKGDEVVVRVIPLENVSAMQLIPVIRPLLPQWSNISSYAPGNVLIVLGRASNLDRVLSIIQDVDKASNSGIQIVPLRHASAPQVALVLNNLQNSARSAGESSPVSIAVDERSNSILLGGPKAMRLRMRVLISQLDGPSASPSGNTEVVYLRYLEAKNLAPLLGKIAQNILGKDTGGHDAGLALPTLPTSMPGGNSPAAGNGSKEASAAPINSTNIQAEPNTNAIIITAPPALMSAIKSIIAKLDVRPAQVLVEAIIAEIDESNLTSLGIQWGTRVPDDKSLSADGQGGLPTAFPSYGAGVVGIIPYVKIKALLSLLRNQSGVNILSTPQIVVLDNQKATIEIGQMVPTQTGSYATSGTGGAVSPTPFNTTDYKNVTLKLDVTPQINLGNSVRLTIALKNDTLQNPLNPGNNPLINTSKISNKVIVASDDVLVLGGLISNTSNENINKVPVLGNMPIIGPLFQQKTSRQQKKNLMVFLKPVIMKNNDDSMTISEMKYSTMRSAQANFRDELREIGDDPLHSRMPPFKGKKDLPDPYEREPGEELGLSAHHQDTPHRLPPWKNGKELPSPFASASKK